MKKLLVVSITFFLASSPLVAERAASQPNTESQNSESAGTHGSKPSSSTNTGAVPVNKTQPDLTELANACSFDSKAQQ